MSRVQMRRGVPLPEGAKYVGRPTQWGNPWQIGKIGNDPEGHPWTRDDVLRWYRQWLSDRLRETPSFLEPLRGYDLACWCAPDERCHADILLGVLAA